jgi:hypothetical protein
MVATKRIFFAALSNAQKILVARLWRWRPIGHRFALDATKSVENV